MKKNIILTVLLFISSSCCFSQINHIEVLILNTEKDISNYLDSLNSLRSNPYYKIKKDISKDGDLILSADFSLADQEFYTCTSIMTRFERLNGIEICTKQIIMGSAKYAQSNLSFIKDNFKWVSDGHWEKSYGANIPLKIIATFERQEGEFPSYVIIYNAEEVK